MKAFITGITGQDGYYLAELLLGKDYEVHGLVRADTPERRARLAPLADQLTLHEGDLRDEDRLQALARRLQPDEVYNLAAESFVGAAWERAQTVAATNGLGALAALQAFAQQDGTRFFQASSAEVFGRAEGIADEQTPLHGRNPYGCAKIFAHNCVSAYREAHGVFACNGILFNHESPRRGHHFVTRKITRAVARIAQEGPGEMLSLGNLDARRDWGFAPDYVRAMWLTLQQDVPGDYVIATGETHSVRAFVEAAFEAVDIAVEWQGTGLDETGRDRATGDTLVTVDPQFFRPTAAAPLRGNAAKARRALGWAPRVSFEALVRTMVEADLERQPAVSL